MRVLISLIASIGPNAIGQLLRLTLAATALVFRLMASASAALKFSREAGEGARRPPSFFRGLSANGVRLKPPVKNSHF
jgi:hypothetical protein